MALTGCGDTDRRCDGTTYIYRDGESGRIVVIPDSEKCPPG